MNDDEAREKDKARFADIKARINLSWLMEMHPQVSFTPDHEGELASICPYHNDTKPSLKQFTGKSGFEEWSCWPCGIRGTCIDWVVQTRGVTKGAALEWLEKLDISAMPGRVAVPPKPPVFVDRPPGNPETQWHKYATPDRKLHCIVVRWPHGEGQYPDGRGKPKVLTYVRAADGRFQCTRPPGPFMPYLWETLAKLPRTAQLVIVEGEGTADRLRKLNVSAFSWIGGTGAVNRTDWGVFARRRALVVADADDSGRAAAQRIADILRSGGSVVELYKPPGDDGKDICDHPEAMVSGEAAVKWMKAQPCTIMEPLPDSIALGGESRAETTAETAAGSAIDLGADKGGRENG